MQIILWVYKSTFLAVVQCIELPDDFRYQLKVIEFTV